MKFPEILKMMKFDCLKTFLDFTFHRVFPLPSSGILEGWKYLGKRSLKIMKNVMKFYTTGLYAPCKSLLVKLLILIDVLCCSCCTLPLRTSSVSQLACCVNSLPRRKVPRSSNRRVPRPLSQSSFTPATKVSVSGTKLSQGMLHIKLLLITVTT